MNIHDIVKCLDFGRKAETELRSSGNEGSWKILAQRYRKAAEDLLIEAKKHQPNPDLSYTRLYKLCNRYDWFTEGDVTQYNDMFEMRDKGATTHDLAVMIWMCSDRSKWTIESIQKILDEKMYCAVLHGDIHYIDEYDMVVKFLVHDAEEDPDWEICEYAGRIKED